MSMMIGFATFEFVLNNSNGLAGKNFVSFIVNTASSCKLMLFKSKIDVFINGIKISLRPVAKKRGQ